MKTINSGQRNAAWAFLSVLFTTTAITINHWYRFGPLALVLGAVVLALAVGSGIWFLRSRRPIALAVYAVMNAWIVVGFGLFKGLWKTVVPMVSGTTIPGPQGMVASGFLMLAGSVFVALTAWQFIRQGQRNAQVRRYGIEHKTRRLVSALLVASVAGLGASLAAQGAARSPIKIGVVATTHGPAGLLGSSFLKSIQLAKEENVDTKHDYELVIEELASPDGAEPAIRKLIERDKVRALIVAMSMSGEIVKPYAADARIPFFCICSVGSLGDEIYTFTTMPLAEDEASLWVAEARRRGIKRVARFTQDFPSIDNHVRAIKAEGEKAGITFVFEDRFAPGTTDFRQAIAAAKVTAPDVFYVEGFNPTLDVLGAQLREAGVTNMASVVAFSISDTPNVFEGGWYTDSYVSPEFKARLERRYPGVRLATHMMPYAYDSYKMLVEAFESGDEVLAYIRRMTEFRGTAGTITKPAGTGNFRSAPAVWEIRNGRPSLLGR